MIGINLKIYKWQPQDAKLNYKIRLGKIEKLNCLRLITREKYMDAGCRQMGQPGTIAKQKCNKEEDTTFTALFFCTSAENDSIYFDLNSPNLCFSACTCLNTSSSSGNADNSSSSRRSKASCFKQTEDCKKENKKNLCNYAKLGQKEKINGLMRCQKEL